ncbi:hypothetical protein AZI85_01880 [Bdellovibrio bacteriovorus]|uniref:HTH deoR-type domain-containing protein n=1 Tax=Bdellovibrio bacteriovorus TaxID=959 RepID=A0A150WW29_BDEBC|nr:DeoR family transcriptional regulator [Bdellovibrio bacteriovorus]KYG70705.1 hypothetical protein AZI85_01880 [Bdellovibrio bacteriovorus]
MSEITKNKTSKQRLSELFFLGHYTTILQIYKDHPLSLAEKDIPFLIGALSFLGKTLEAEEIFKTRQASFSEKEQAASLFYLGVGVARKSKYKKARRFFRENQKRFGKHDQAEISFYTYQGIAFYLYFTGQFFRSEKFATKALRLAVRAENPHIKVLAQDLLAHTLVQTGRVYSGLELLKEAHDIALRLGNDAFASATQVSILLYEATYGHRPESIVPDLEKCLNDLKPQDSYSKSNVVLELARQKTLRGLWKDAETLLNLQAPVIFSSENRRQEIVLNLRWAELAYLRGQTVLAWQYLRGANLRLNQEADKNFAIQILGLEHKILTEQNNPSALEKKKQLLELSRSFSSKINRNMLARRQWIQEKDFSEDDHIHTLLSQIGDNSGFELIHKSGYYSWYYKCLPLQKGVNYLVLGLAKNRAVTFSTDGIEVVKLADFSARILEVLKQGPLDKAMLVEKVWGYEYHPLRHDSLVYAAMSTLRRNLGSKHTWIQTLDTGYQLEKNVNILQLRGSIGESKNSGSMVLKSSSLRPVDAELNYRQLQALDYLQENRFLSTRQYKDLFKTTEITACRDLAALNKKGHVVRIGFGRATQYTLAQGDRK